MDLRPIVLSDPGGLVRLEPLEPHHAPGLLALAQEPELWTWMPETLGTRAQVDAWIERSLAGRAARTELAFAIVHAPSGALAGSTRYIDVQPANRSLEIGWTWIGRAFRRSPVNTRCKLLLLSHAFEGLGAERVQLKCDARNQRSRLAIERIGATWEGTLRRHRVMPDGFVRDSVYFSVIREEWPLVKARLVTLA